MTNAAKEREMIVGTEGGKDYLVIAEQDGFVLGLKPLLLIGPDTSQYGFRLRMQQGFDEKPDIENKNALLEGMQSVFKDVPWAKRSSTRFSTVLLTECAYGVELLDEVKKDALGNFGKLIDTIVESIAPIAINDPVDLVNFVTERYTTMIDEVDKAYAEYTSKKQKTEGVADVLAFPSSDDVE